MYFGLIVTVKSLPRHYPFCAVRMQTIRQSELSRKFYTNVGE
jgi:hypothetical protein